jgi:signal transduction histidine kinase
MDKQHKKLKEAYKKLQDSYELMVNQEKLASLGTMAAGLAHEINNPTQAIKFSLEGLKLNINDLNTLLMELNNINQDDTDSALEIKEKLKNLLKDLDIETALEEITDVSTENLKSIERIEGIINSTYRLSFSGEQWGEVNLNQVIDDSLMLAYNRYKSVCQIETQLEDNLPPIFAIHQQLEQVLLNLIINAIDAIADKKLLVHEGLIKISCYSNLPKTEIYLMIEDNGSGIEKEIINKIFDPFYTTKKVGKGTGLGLNIVHKIIKSHKAKIDVESEISKGTTFTLTFPVYKEE